MKEFTVHVDGIRRNEFLQANHFMALTQYIAVAVLLVVMAVAILVINGAEEFAKLWTLVIVIPLAPIVYQFSFSSTYKKYPYGELAMDYVFDELGWRLTVKDQSGVVAWVNTTKLRRTKTVFLLYAQLPHQKKPSSNVIPRRCLTDEQAEQITAWFNAKKKK